DVRADCTHAGRRGCRRSARWRVHHLSRAPAAAGLQHRAPQRRDPPVRQLSAHPLFRVGCRGGRQLGAAVAMTGRPSDVVAYIDGGARGNPGPAGFGVRLEGPDGSVIDELSESIGVATNNVAEYRGLLAALEWARSRGVKAVHVRSDSQLLVQQMLG